jgi:aldose 1-epimerase
MDFGDEVVLRSGSLSLTLAPGLGGGITRFWIDDGAPCELFRRAPRDALEKRDPLELASYPLLPFSNRIDRGRFSFGGRDFEIVPNLPPHPHPLHGHGWRMPWSVTARDESSATLELEYAGGDWPSAYRATQRLELTPQALSVRIALENAGPLAMPAGIGMHPYLDRTPQSRLTANVTSVWLADDACLPREHVPVPSTWDFAERRLVGELELDNCFSGWDGRAIVEWPERATRLSISADPIFDHLVVYVPRERDFFCVEPVTHANDAIHLAARGVPKTGHRILNPGETLAGEVRFHVERLRKAKP